MNGEYLGLIATAIGGVAIGLMTAIAKYWLDSDKQKDDHDSHLLDTLMRRINDLEKHHKECLDQQAQLRERIGYLEAVINGIKDA